MPYLLGELFEIFFEKMLPGAEWVISLNLNKNLEISPSHGGINDLRDLRENSTNILMRDRNLRSNQ